MKILDFPLLADENIHPKVVQSLIAEGLDVCSVMEHDLQGRDDSDILRFAKRQGRVVITHDSDFGMLGVRDGIPFTGILYLRPGHLPSAGVIAMLKALKTIAIDVAPGFIVVVEQKGEVVRVRARLSAVV